MKRAWFYSSPFLILLLIAVGCSDTKVAAYRAAKEHEVSLPSTSAGEMPEPSGSTPPGIPTSGDAVVSTASGQPLVWNAPSTWQKKAAGAMRKGSFTIAGENGEAADLSITAFPGAVGGELANLNRWRGQLSLPPVDERALDANVTRLRSNDLTFTIVDCSSTEASPRRILGAMTPYQGAMWFFKLTGPDTVVSAAKPSFLEFLKTVKVAPEGTP